MNRIANARRLRREQTDEEKELWHALRAGRFAGFKFRRQHPVGTFHLDFYCPTAKLSVELDGSQHGMPEQRRRDEAREKFLAQEGIEEMRFWNHQWWRNREGVLLEIWHALHRRTGCESSCAKRRTIVTFRRNWVGSNACQESRPELPSLRLKLP